MGEDLVVRGGLGGVGEEKGQILSTWILHRHVKKLVVDLERWLTG